MPHNKAVCDVKFEFFENFEQTFEHDFEQGSKPINRISMRIRAAYFA